MKKIIAISKKEIGLNLTHFLNSQIPVLLKYLIFLLCCSKTFGKSNTDNTHSPVVKIDIGFGECTAFKMDPTSDFLKLASPQYDYWGTAAHCCLFNTKITIPSLNNMAAVPIAYNPFSDWCVMQANKTPGVGLKIHPPSFIRLKNPFLWASNRKMPIYSESSYMFIKYFSEVIRFGISIFKGEPGDSGSPLIQNGQVVGILSASDEDGSLFATAYRMSLYFNPNITQDTYQISENGNYCFYYRHTFQDGILIADKQVGTLSSGEIQTSTNWKQDSSGSQTAEKRVAKFPSGEIQTFTNWKQDSSGSQTAEKSVAKFPSGEIQTSTNWKQASNGSKTAEKRVAKFPSGEIQTSTNWKQDSNGSQTAKKRVDKFPSGHVSTFTNWEQASNGSQTAKKMVVKFSSGEIQTSTNWKQASNGSQTAKKRVDKFLSGDVRTFINWKRASNGSQTADEREYKFPSGHVSTFTNWKQDSSGSQTAEKKVDKFPSGEIRTYPNWRQN